MTPAPDDRAVRAARSGVAVCAAVLVALTGHVAGGGAAPAPLLVVAVLALAWPAGLLLVGRRPSLLRQTAVVGVAQAMLHGVFALGTAAPASSTDAMVGMHHVHDAVLPRLVAAPMPHGSGMLWAHLLAAAVTVAAWRWGETALRRLLAHAPFRRLLALLRPLAAPPARARPRSRLRTAPLASAPRSAHRDRGPPLLA